MAAMGNGDGTGARSNARRDVEVTDGLGPWRSVGRVKGHGIHSEWHGYNCRREGNHQYMLKCVENAKLTCWSWETRPGQTQKPREHAKHVHKYTWRCGTRKNGRRHVSICLIDPEPPDSPTGNARQHSDLPDGLESHTNTLKMRRHVHGDVDGSNTPESVSVTPDLPARGAVSRVGEPEWPMD